MFKWTYPISDSRALFFRGSNVLQGIILIFLSLVWLVQELAPVTSQVGSWANEVASALSFGIAFAGGLFLAGEFSIKVEGVVTLVLAMVGFYWFGIYWLTLPGLIGVLAVFRRVRKGV